MIIAIRLFLFSFKYYMLEHGILRKKKMIPQDEVKG